MTATTSRAAVSSTSPETVRSMEREVRALMRRIRRRSAENARRVHPDLPVSAYLVLLFVSENGSARACDVVEDLNMDKGAVSRHITLLCGLGLIERSDDPGDRRVQTLRVTTVGRRKVRDVTEHRQSQIVRRLERWSAEDLSSFVAQLRRFNEVLDD